MTKIRSRLTAEELIIADRRGDGQSWEQIASDLDESAESLRKRLERALQRVREELNADSL